MTTEWAITQPAEQVRLNGGRGQVAFTVTNQGSAPDRAVFEIVPGDGADGSWFPPPEEPQRLVAGQASATFLATVAIPPGAAAGTYWLQARVYSADSPPEESSRLSGRVAFTVAAAARPKRTWWPYAVAGALVIAVIAVVGFLVLGGDDTSDTDSPATQAQDCVDGYVWREAVPGDHVCVIPQRHEQALADNAQADARREPGGGAYGPNTCVAGYVWRVATPEDLVCVLPQTRTETAEDNALADSRRRPS